MPSWLTLDSSTGILYCSDETGGTDSHGSLFALAPDGEKGGFKELAKTVAPGGGVSSVIYGGEDGRRKFLAVAH